MNARIYIASKTRHAARWRALRAEGVPIISTWIDEAGPGETRDFTGLWERCVHEAATATVVILYAEPGDVLEGAFIEVGAALAFDVPVLVVGEQPGWSWTRHPLVSLVDSVEEAIRWATVELGPLVVPPATVSHPVDWNGTFRGTDADPREVGWCDECEQEVTDGQDDRHRKGTP